jgi:hypothetical protein
MSAPNYVVDQVFSVVESAIGAGLSVTDFRKLCAEAWETALQEKRRYDRREWEREG